MNKNHKKLSTNVFRKKINFIGMISIVINQQYKCYDWYGTEFRVIYIYYIDLNDSILLINNDKIKTYSHTKDNIEQNRGGAANKNGEKKKLTKWFK